MQRPVVRIEREAQNSVGDLEQEVLRLGVVPDHLRHLTPGCLHDHIQGHGEDRVAGALDLRDVQLDVVPPADFVPLPG